MKNSSRTIKVAGAAVATIALALAPLAPAQAATSAWGVWTYIQPGSAPADPGIAFNNAAFADATFTINADIFPTVEVLNVDDEDEWFTAETPIGAVFGANGPSTTNNFLKIESPDNTTTDSILAVTFATPVKAGNLGFAVSDLDTDHVTVTATDAAGAAVSGSDLLGSASSTAAFNFCDVADSPGGCSDTDVPTVETNATDVVATGSASNTDGSTVWFQPSVDIATVTFTYRNDDGGNSSSSRYWFAQKESTLANTGASASTMLGMFGIGSALLAAGAIFVMRRRQA
jgi:LPXTG-motif cell wall-anchored protein